ncbi:MAG: hypothetical protein LCH70_13935 [Proteobacteria bacterium]|nr:hypothetical protein [Pseudomonadota bacterium]
MNGKGGYAVFFFPQALEVLGGAIKPYLQDSLTGPHVACDEVDTAGGFVEMTLHGRTPEGRDVKLELMVPSSMVLMIVSTQQDGSFGFRPHQPEVPATPALPAAPAEPAAPAAPAAPAEPGEPGAGGAPP